MKGPQNIIRNERGIALLETIPLLVIFVMLTSFALGMFGIVHTSVLHSIAARTYAFETFRSRTNLYYFRENTSGLSQPQTYYRKGWRFHAIENESDLRDVFVPSARPIALGREVASGDSSVETNNQGIYEMKARNERISVSPAWIMVGYGICLNMKCGNN